MSVAPTKTAMKTCEQVSDNDNCSDVHSECSAMYINSNAIVCEQVSDMTISDSGCDMHSECSDIDINSNANNANDSTKSGTEEKSFPFSDNNNDSNQQHTNGRNHKLTALQSAKPAHHNISDNMDSKQQHSLGTVVCIEDHKHCSLTSLPPVLHVPTISSTIDYKQQHSYQGVHVDHENWNFTLLTRALQAHYHISESIDNSQQYIYQWSGLQVGLTTIDTTTTTSY